MAAIDAFKRQLLNKYHTTFLGGCAGSLRTFARLAKLYFWKGIRKVVVDFGKSYMVYQQVKEAHTKPGGILQPLPIPMGIWKDIAMDFILVLLPSKGFSDIFIVVEMDISCRRFLEHDSSGSFHKPYYEVTWHSSFHY